MAGELKAAVLGSVVGRPSYGYMLEQALGDLLGDAYQLRRSAVYRALKALEEEGLVAVDERRTSRSAGRRQARVWYAATGAGERAFHDWISAPPAAQTEPVRSELVARVALAGREEAPHVLEQVYAEELECIALIEAARATAAEAPARSDWERQRAELVHSYGLRHLDARLDWLRDARATLEALLEREE